MKKYLVTGTFQYEVEAENVEGAEIAAADEYMENPETDYEVKEISALEEPETLIIRFERASDEGYMYDIFLSEEAMESNTSLDGGQCTTTLLNALGMAVDGARGVIARSIKN